MNMKNTKVTLAGLIAIATFAVSGPSIAKPEKPPKLEAVPVYQTTDRTSQVELGGTYVKPEKPPKYEASTFQKPEKPPKPPKLEAGFERYNSQRSYPQVEGQRNSIVAPDM